ncbi:hypothetical protein AHiyo4_35290 [Arthrobacter sp. Hiyo4]|nr:hypothetical protein AHiyo4_35290 [Arthrobacter sp. Hiyo4]
MIVQLRICVPSGLSAVALDACKEHTGTAEVALFPGASVSPRGDVIDVQVAREAVEELLEKLHVLKAQEVGSIAISMPELVLSRRADKAEASAPGDGADALIWDEVTRQTGEDSRLTWSYLAFLILATQLAAIGIVTNSTIAIVGAMAVGRSSALWRHWQWPWPGASGHSAGVLPWRLAWDSRWPCCWRP